MPRVSRELQFARMPARVEERRDETAVEVLEQAGTLSFGPNNMREYACIEVRNDERLSAIPERDAFVIRFEFDIVPIEYHGKPNEKAYVETKSLRVKVSGSTLRHKLPRDEADRMRILFYYATLSLSEGTEDLTVDSDYIDENPVVAERVSFPPKYPFNVDCVVRMGFH